MNEELLKSINEKLNMEFDMKSYKDSADVLREVLSRNNENIIQKVENFSSKAWTEENMDLFVDIIKAKPEKERKDMSLGRLGWGGGLKNNQLFMKKCLNADLDINYNFIVQDELIDDEALEMFVTGDKKIPRYNNGFFYKAENIDRIFQYGEVGLKYITDFKDDCITKDVLNKMLEYGEIGIKYISELNRSFLDEDILGKILEKGEVSMPYIYNFPLKSWTEQNVEKVVGILKNNSNLNLNSPWKVPLRNCKLLLKRCLEEDLNYNFFNNDEIYDEEIVKLIVDKRKYIPMYVNGFFYKEKNFFMLLQIEGALGYIRHFDKKVLTPENMELYCETIREKGIENRYNPDSMVRWKFFNKEFSSNENLLDACIDSKSVTVFDEFSQKELWTDERIEKIIRIY